MNVKDAPFDLCMKVLKRLSDAGVLKDIVLIGSWSTYFYSVGKVLKGSIGTLRTDDVDFLVPIPLKTDVSVNIPQMVKDLGFVVKHGLTGQMALEHADMRIDFLVPERGRGSDKPYYVDSLGVSAQRLRFMDFLLKETILIESGSLAIRAPHPARFGLHKLIVSERRSKLDKAVRDREQGVDVLRAVTDRGDGELVRRLFSSLPKGWKASILKAIGKADAEDLRSLL